MLRFPCIHIHVIPANLMHRSQGSRRRSCPTHVIPADRSEAEEEPGPIEQRRPGGGFAQRRRAAAGGKYAPISPAPLAGRRILCFPSGMGGYVYILASRKNGTLYVGVTGDLERRMWEHREGMSGGFAQRYRAMRLVWYRDYHDIRDAIDDEKRIKRWRRKWKLELIETMNPGWDDLHDTLGS